MNSSGKLFIVSTPIGHRDDLSMRALDILLTVDEIATEDTRHFGRLAEKFQITTPRFSFHAHSSPEKVLQKLESGKNIALVSDAGTPGISDPGSLLIAQAIQKGIAVSPIPGASAFLAALSASGLPMHHFEFFGFIPHKKGRDQFLKTIAEREHTSIFYESSHRIEKCLQQMGALFADRWIVIAREITKIHEEFLRGSPREIQEIFEKNPEKKKGEFVVLVSPKMHGGRGGIRTRDILGVNEAL